MSGKYLFYIFFSVARVCKIFKVLVGFHYVILDARLDEFLHSTTSTGISLVFVLQSTTKKEKEKNYSNKKQ